MPQPTWCVTIYAMPRGKFQLSSAPLLQIKKCVCPSPPPTVVVVKKKKVDCGKDSYDPCSYSDSGSDSSSYSSASSDSSSYGDP